MIFNDRHFKSLLNYWFKPLGLLSNVLLDGHRPNMLLFSAKNSIFFFILFYLLKSVNINSDSLRQKDVTSNRYWCINKIAECFWFVSAFHGYATEHTKIIWNMNCFFYFQFNLMGSPRFFKKNWTTAIKYLWKGFLAEQIGCLINVSLLTTN